MNSRLSKLPKNSLVQTIKGLQTQIAALKQAQKTSAQSGVLSYQTVSDQIWDLTGTVGSNSDTVSNGTTINVVWTGDGSQDIAFASLAFDVYVNGTDSAHQLTPQSPTWTSGTLWTDPTAEINYAGLTISRHTYTYQIDLTTLKQITYYIKAYVTASCPGTVEVSVV